MQREEPRLGIRKPDVWMTGPIFSSQFGGWLSCLKFFMIFLSLCWQSSCVLV